MVDCFSANTEGVEEAASQLDIDFLDLKNFCTFDKAFLCFWPFPWWVSADFPLDDNSITLWLSLHQGFLFLLILHQPIFELWIIKPTIHKIFLFFFINHFLLHNYAFALKKLKERILNYLRTCWSQCFSIDFIGNNIKIFW